MLLSVSTRLRMQREVGVAASGVGLLNGQAPKRCTIDLVVGGFTVNTAGV
jgi:hypothetical protein